MSVPGIVNHSQWEIDMMKKSWLTTILALALTLSFSPAYAGNTITNGYFGGQEIYYIDQGMEKKTERMNTSDIFLIGDNRAYQPNVVLTVPGQPGYSPHWDVVVVHTAPGYTVDDIMKAGLAGKGVLFDSAENILEAARRGLVTLTEAGVVVLCPIVPAATADAKGHTETPETFMPLTRSSTF